MGIFCITFRIHEDASYSDRYNSTVEAIKNVCHGEYWDEPTSFFLFENPSTSAKIAEYIEANSQFAKDRDLLLVTNLSQKAFATDGKVKKPQTLKNLMDKR
jgi:hypothetical protein